MKCCHLCTLIRGNTTARMDRFEYGSPWEDFEISVTYVTRKESISEGDESFLLVRGRNQGELKEMIQLQLLYCSGKSKLSQKPCPSVLLLDYASDVAVESHSDDASCALSTASSATQELTRLWLNECTSSHKRCNAIQQGRGPTGMGNDASIKLVTTASLDACPVYTALSYCWGGRGDFKLLKSNFQRLLKRTSTSELPKTIQDAIKTT
jgi:hypothetical protein